MRFFIALEIPLENKLQLEQVQKGLKNLFPEIRLMDSNKLHLTIAFVGEQKEELKEDLVKVIKKSTEAMAPFIVTPAYIDGFPNLHHPHTIWAGVKGDIDRLLILRERVKDGLASLNLEVDERRFIPHIALAKAIKLNITPSQEVEIEKLMAINFNELQVSSVKLFESIPEGGLHTHNTLAEVFLDG